MHYVKSHMDDAAQLELLKKALRAYAGPHVLSRVLDRGEQALRLGGDVVVASVMFTDIARFLPSADKFDSSAVEAVVNDYFTALVSSTTAHGGVFDSLIGDSAISYWVGNEHAERACVCACDVVARLAHDATTKSSASRPRIVPQIGIHTGKVLLGNYGDPERLRFTVLGAAVNLASRLSGLASGVYGLPVVISERTKELLTTQFSVSALEEINVKGLENPLMLYGLGET